MLKKKGKKKCQGGVISLHKVSDGNESNKQTCLMPSSDASLDDMSSTASYNSDEEYRLAQQEWEESLHQLQQLFAVVLLPIFGKWMGRRWSRLGSFTLEIMAMLS
jgi:Mitochondrial import 2